MTAQPEALRLADALEMSSNHGIRREAAAELRRLQIDGDARDVHLSERMKDLFKVEAQRDALLEALKAMLTHMGMDEDEWNKPTFDQARAAIAKCEENT